MPRFWSSRPEFVDPRPSQGAKMPDAYEIHDAQFLQVLSVTSAADALAISLPSVPAGKVWTFLSAYVNCSVAETQIYWFGIQNPNYPGHFPVTVPASRLITPAVYSFYPMVNEGMEIKVFQNESLVVRRAAATAGSTISISGRFIENDMPFYQELEKHANRIRFRRAAQVSGVRASRSGGFDRGGREPGGRERR